MKLTTQSQRAVMAMMALALHNDRNVLRLSNLAKEQGISLSYMEQLFYALRHAGLVEGIRGPGGGYRLGRPASRITIAQIVQAIETGEDEEELVAKAGSKKQEGAENLAVSMMLDSLDEQVFEFLDGITLDSLTRKHQKVEPAYRAGTTASLIARMFPARGLGMPQPVGI